jgi:hypothetical protein
MLPNGEGFRRTRGPRHSHASHIQCPIRHGDALLQSEELAQIRGLPHCWNEARHNCRQRLYGNNSTLRTTQIMMVVESAALSRTKAFQTGVRSASGMSTRTKAKTPPNSSQLRQYNASETPRPHQSPIVIILTYAPEIQPQFQLPL